MTREGRVPGQAHAMKGVAARGAACAQARSGRRLDAGPRRLCREWTRVWGTGRPRPRLGQSVWGETGLGLQRGALSSGQAGWGPGCGRDWAGRGPAEGGCSGGLWGVRGAGSGLRHPGGGPLHRLSGAWRTKAVGQGRKSPHPSVRHPARSPARSLLGPPAHRRPPQAPAQPDAVHQWSREPFIR